MAELLRVGVSLYLVDRISSDLRRVAFSMRGSAEDVDLLTQRISLLQGVMTAKGAWREAQQVQSRYMASIRQERAYLAREIEITKRKGPALGFGARGAGQMTYAQYMLPGMIRRSEEIESEINRLGGNVARAETAYAQTSMKRLEAFEKENAIQERLLAAQRQQESQRLQQMAGVSEQNVLMGMGLMAVGRGILSLPLGAERAYMPIGQQLAMAQLVGPMTPAQSGQLFDMAQQIAGAAGIFRATNVIGIGQSMLQAGMPVPEMMANLSRFTRMSEVLSLMNLGQPEEIASEMTKLSRILGVRPGKGMEDITQRIFGVAMHTGTPVPQLLTQIASVAQAAKVMGFSPAEIVRSVGAAELLGAKGGLRPELMATFLTRMIAGQPKAAAALAKGLHISSKDIHEMGSLQKALETEYNKNPQRFTAFAMLAFGGTRGVRTALALAQPEFAEALKTIDDMLAKTPEVNQAFATMINTSSSQLSRLGTNLGQVAETIGRQADPAVQKFLTHLADGAQKLNEFLQAHPGLATNLGVTVPSIAGASMLMWGGARLLGGIAPWLLPWGVGDAAGAGITAAGGFTSMFGLNIAAALALAQLGKHIPGFENLGALTPGGGGLSGWSLMFGGKGEGAFQFGRAPEYKYEEKLPDKLHMAPEGRAGGYVPPISFRDIHVHVGMIKEAMLDDVKRAVMDGIHRAMYNVGTPGEGITHEWPFTSPDTVTT